MAVVTAVLELLSEYPLLFLTAAIIAGLTVWIWRLVNGSGSGPNPFSDRSHVRPAAPLVLDQKLRDQVLKQGFHVNKVPHDLDAIVVGSGIGGLAAANLLARTGKRVLVLEQHDQAGGCCHTFIDKGFEFDVGIHYIGGMDQGEENRVLIDHLTDGQLDWCPLDDTPDVVALGEPGKQEFFPFMKGFDAWRKMLVERFPGEEKGIDKFLALCEEVKPTMFGLGFCKVAPKWLVRFTIATGLIHLITKYFRYARRTTREVLNEVTNDEKLRLMFYYSFGDYGTMPSDSSFIMQAILLTHFRDGGWYPLGGASEIAFHLIPAIERAGGKVLVRAPVSNILTNVQGHAIGVRVHRSSGDLDLHAPLVISDAGVVNTFKSLLPQDVAQRSCIHKLLHKKVQSGVGTLSLFVGLRGTTKELGLKAYNTWAFTGADGEARARKYLNLTAKQAMESEVPLLFTSFPSAKDPSFSVRFPGKSVCTMVTLANWDWFKAWENERVNKRGEEYDDIKNAIRDQMWAQVVKCYPQLQDKVEFMELGTPVSNKYYIGSPRGEIYGLDHDLARFSDPEILINLRPGTDIPGLMLTGQDVMTCGFSGALMGAVFCAGVILQRNLYADMMRLRKSLKTKQ